MSAPANLEIEVHLTDDAAPASVTRDIFEGLTGTPKRLSSKYFYDERGSRLFEKITELPEYYLTRAETALLERSSRAIARLTGMEELVELGSGAATKTRILIDAGLAEGLLRRYIPVEVSQGIVERSARRLAASYPELEVHAVVGDFEHHLGKVPDGGNRLVALLGSTIGNFSRADASELLRTVRSLMDERDWFLLGTDLVKDVDTMQEAYNDEQGVTAEFNRNILNVVNRWVDGNFRPENFEHVAVYNEMRSRIESSLRSSCAHGVRLEKLGLDLRFAEGELLHTEISCKYTRESVEDLLSTVGLHLQHWFTDPDRTFALSLSRGNAGS